MIRKPRLKHGELGVHVLRFSRDELAAVPAVHRSFYLLMGQFNNELTILQGLTLQAVQSVRGPDTVREPTLGMMLFFVRLMSGRLYELWQTINSRENGKLLDELWQTDVMRNIDQSPYDAGIAGRKQLNKYFGRGALLGKIRNKLAYHLDQSQMDEGFALLPNDISLSDFHTGIRGTTFFGAADTVTLYAIAHLAELDDALDAAKRLVDEALKAFVAAVDFIEAYLAAFTISFYGLERFASMPIEVLRDAPVVGSTRLHFFLRPKKSGA